MNLHLQAAFQLAGKQLGRERARGPGGHNLSIRRNFYDEGGQTLEQVTQTGYGVSVLEILKA